MKFRKRPVVIDAWPVADLLWAAKHNWPSLPTELREAYDKGAVLFLPYTLEIVTLEGRMEAEGDDWVVCGVKGELYPCKPDVFAVTYDAEQEAERG